MQSKHIVLCLCVLIAPTAWAQNKTYTVRQGDTISDIASRNKVRRAELVSANKQLQNPHKLKLGMVLTIPKSGLAQADNGKTTAVRSSASVAKPATQHSYAVRNGDKDWSIARKFGISVKQLQAANKGADLSSLRPGDKLTLPKGPSIQVKTASAAPKAVAVKGATVVHKVKAGENDWIIARRYDTTVAKIRAVNPGVERPLQIGTELKIPVAGKISTIAAVTTAKKITTRMARVKGESSIIRRGPSTSAEKITVVPAGTQVTVLDHESGWYKLRFPKGTVGWMRGDLLEPISASKVAALVKSQRKDSQIERASVRIKASQKVVKKAPAAKPVSKPTTKPATKKPVNMGSVDDQDLLSRAYALRGTRYRWGGTSRSGFDCSGFVGTVYRSEGVKLPRTSRAMAKVGQTVGKGSLKPGDLVFFKTRGGSRISHVGIYAGNNKFIHSSSGKGGVRVDSLGQGYYSKRLVTAKRVANPTKSSTSKPARKDEPKGSSTVVAHKDEPKATAEHPTSKRPIVGTMDEIIQ